MNIDTLHRLVSDFCVRANLPAPVFDDAHCVLAPQPGQPIIVAWDENEQDLVLIAPVGTQTAALDESAAMQLLHDAYLGQNLSGAAAGIDPDTGGLVLWRRLPAYGLTADQLERYIGRTALAARALDNGASS